MFKTVDEQGMLYLVDSICLATPSRWVQAKLHELPFLVCVLFEITLSCFQAGTTHFTLPAQHCTDTCLLLSILWFLKDLLRTQSL